MEPNEIIMRTPQSIQGLDDMIQWIEKSGFNPGKMKLVEIGVFLGDSTEVFCKHFKKVDSIDPWVSDIGDITSSCDMNKIFDAFVLKMGSVLNLNVIRDYSFNAVKQFQDGSIDMVYIDGSHEYKDVKRDLKDWISKVRKGGIVAGHDFRDKFKGVKNAVMESVGKPKAIFRDSSWITIKK